MARETFPYSYTSPYIHLWIFETLWVIIFWVWVLTHPTPTWPTPPLHDPPHPTPPHPSWPTPPHPTPSWPTPPHPTPPLVHFGHKGAFFHGLLHYVSLSVDNKSKIGLLNISCWWTVCFCHWEYHYKRTYWVCLFSRSEYRWEICWQLDI